MKFSLAFLVALALTGAANIHASPVRNSNELNDVLKEFLDLVPQDKVIEIVLEYLEKDGEVQAAMEYAQSQEFKALVSKVESIEDVINFYKYLDESGLDIYGLVNKVHEVIGLPPFVPPRHARKARITGGVAGLIADIKAVLPIDKIKALYNEKLETSPAFAELVERLSSPRFQELIDALRANKEFQNIVEHARQYGIDVEHIKDLLSTMFGLQFPSKKSRAPNDLNDDLHDFLAILPIDKITELALDYIENDPQIQETIEYLESKDFHQIVQEVEAMKEARDVLAFLEESGLNAYDFLNSIHEILGIPPFKPSDLHKRSVSKASGGLSGLIADIKAILPIDDIKALYYYKLENSIAFTNLIRRLSSQEFQEFVNAVLEKEEAQVILQKLKTHGVDIEAVADLLNVILGLKFPKPVMARASDELTQDLLDFIKLVPLEDVVDISVDYVLNDPEVQKAAVYIRSKEFQELAIAAEQNNEFRVFVRYLDESGLPASQFINNINLVLGLPELDTSLRRSVKAGGGVRGMLDAIEATLPREEIKALYEYKKKNSKAFAYMIERLEADEFQSIVDQLAANKDFQNLGYQAASFGIDLQVIVDFLKKVFGIEIDAGLIPE